MLPVDFTVQKDAGALQFMILDVLQNILHHCDHPGHMGSYLTRQLRELVGGRIVVLMQCLTTPEHVDHSVVSVTPERYRMWNKIEALHELARLSHDVDRCTLWDSSGASAAVQALLREMDCNAAIVLPLRVGTNRVGVLFVLELSDMQRTPDILRALDILSPVVALILRNAAFYESQEAVIQARTQELALSEQRFRSLAQVAPVGIFRSDAAGRFVFTNDRWRRVTGLTPEEVGSEEWSKAIHPDDQARVMQGWHEARAACEPFRTECRLVHPDGEVVWVIGEAVPELDETGAFSGYIGTLTDITESKRAEEEKEKLTLQLLQAQKMEAVGQLAGGVAHDFNNMLGVILGYAELLKLDLSADDPRLANVLEIEQAAGRSRDITRQLLAFSRKQIIAPRPMDLNAVIAGTQKTLVRLIGEDIDLRFHPEKDLRKIMIDPSQVDQILVNLAINARDAMPRGGQLTVETGNIDISEAYCRDHLGFEPGRYVLLAVSDDGVGMDHGMLSHIFEPFFTTKETGKGTGLGLATVYGIVKQNNGFINVYSEPGQGTTFRIYFPCVVQDVETQESVKKASIVSGTGGTILLVEDDEMVRQMTEAMLEKIGYRVLVAETPLIALQLCAGTDMVFDLLLTDVVMPEMSGKELSERIEAVRPGIKVLFMSGYTANGIVLRGVLEEGVHFIQKPFSMNDLAQKVLEAIRGS